MRWSRYDVGRYHIHASVYVQAFMNTANMLLINMSDSSDTLQEIRQDLVRTWNICLSFFLIFCFLILSILPYKAIPTQLHLHIPFQH